MPQDPDDPQKGWEGDYRVYRSGSESGRRTRASTHAARSKGQTAEGDAPANPSGGSAGGGAPPDFGGPPRPEERGEDPGYNLYRSQPRGLIARLRGESDADIGERVSDRVRRIPRGRQQAVPGMPWWHWRRFTWRRALGLVAGLAVAWVALSVLLFVISAQTHAGNLPAGAKSQLTGGGPMLFSANTVLVVGLDNRPSTGPGSKEPGANFNERFARTDTIMLWRIGGGVSRRLSIPRDTLVDIPGYGENKINAAWAFGGPKLAMQTIKQFTGLKINHLIVVDLANFPKFIDAIGGVTVKTARICSEISGGRQNGGFTLNLQPGSHHLSGLEALTLARTRENSCNPAYTDIQREEAQQQILNGIKSQLFSAHAFFNLPWVAWDAPGVIQTDMGSLSLAQLFLSAEIGGSPRSHVLKETPSFFDGQDVLVPNSNNVKGQVRRLLHG